MKNQKRRPPLFCFNTIIRNYVKLRDFGRVKFVVGLMQDFGVPSNDWTYHFIIQMYIFLSDVDEIDRVIDIARRKSVVLTKLTYIELLKFYVRAHLPEKVDQTNKALRDSYKLDVGICNCIIGFLNGKDVDDAFWDMINRGIRPNEYTFRILIRKFKRKNDLLDKVVKVMDKYGIKYRMWNNNGRIHIFVDNSNSENK